MAAQWRVALEKFLRFIQSEGFTCAKLLLEENLVMEESIMWSAPNRAPLAHNES